MQGIVCPVLYLDSLAALHLEEDGGGGESGGRKVCISVSVSNIGDEQMGQRSATGWRQLFIIRQEYTKDFDNPVGNILILSPIVSGI